MVIFSMILILFREFNTLAFTFCVEFIIICYDDKIINSFNCLFPCDVFVYVCLWECEFTLTNPPDLYPIGQPPSQTL